MSSTRFRIAAALLALLVCLAYLPVVRCGFVWDDDSWVSANPVLTSPGALRAIWLDPTSHQQYYPLVPTSFWLESRLWGLHPLGFHLTNVALHATCAVLVFVLLSRLAVPAAWIAAAIFALHPVHVESVAWITERKNVLSGVFYFSAAIALVRAFGLDRAPSTATKDLRRAYGLGCAFFVLALLAKTVTATLPAALLLAIWWKRGRISRTEVLGVAPMIALGAVAGFGTAWLERNHVGAEGVSFSLTPADEFVLAGRAVWFYLEKLVWPHPLIAVYPRFSVDGSHLRQALAPAALFGVVLTLWLARRKIGRGPLTAALYYVGTLVPALGFFNVYFMRYSFVADHFQYLASIGPIALIVAAVAVLVRSASTRTRRAAVVASGLVIAVFAALSWNQVWAYRSEETLWRDTIAKNPAAWMAHTNLGLLLARSGRVQEAMAHYREAIRHEAPFREPRLNLGELLQRMGRADEALVVISEEVRLRPGDPISRFNYGTALGKTGRFPEAEAQLREALRLRPAFAAAEHNLATVLERTGRIEEAIASYERVLALRPDYPGTRAHLDSLIKRSQ